MLHDQWNDNRNGHNHQRKRLDKEAEHDVNHYNDHDRLERRQTEPLQKLLQLATQTGRGQREVQERRADHDQHDHGGDLDCADQALRNHVERYAAEKGRDQKGACYTDGGCLGWGGPAFVYRADYHGEQCDDRKQVHQRAQHLDERIDPSLATQFRTDHADDHGDDDEPDGQRYAGQQTCKEQLRDRGLGQKPIDDQVDRRRDHDAQCAASRDSAGKQFLVIAQPFRLRHGDGGNCGCCRD